MSEQMNSYLTFIDFTRGVREEIHGLFPNDKVTIEELKKDNGTQIGICVKREEIKIAPVLYLDGYYRKYVNDELSFSEACRAVYNTFIEEFKKGDIDVEWLKDFEKIKDNLFIGAMNIDLNKEQLEDIPAWCVGDIAFYMYANIDMGIRGTGRIKIKYEHLKGWNFLHNEVHDLFDYALCNMIDKARVQLIAMEDLLVGMLDSSPDVKYNEKLNGKPDITNKDSFLYVLKSDKENDAGIAYCGDIMDKIAETIGDGFYMIPSSVHEWIIIKNNSGMKFDDIAGMIPEVNLEVVDRKDWLSNSLYRYDLTRGLTVAKEGDRLE